MSDHRAHMERSYMCPVVTHMNPVRDTNSEPGLLVVVALETVFFVGSMLR